MAKLREGEKRVQLCFIRPEDVRLYEFMQREAYRCRWEIQTFILASLTEAFAEKMAEDEVEAIAAEAAQKVRERANTPAEHESQLLVRNTEDLFPGEPKPLKLPAVSMEDAAKQAEAQIAQLDAVASTMMAKRLSARKVPGSPPPMPPLPTSTQLDMDKPPALPRRKNSAASGSRS